MRGGLLILAVLWGTAAYAQPKSSKTEVSQNGEYSVKLTETGKDTCRLETSRGQDPLWALDKCVGSADDLYFISNDGSRVWVLRTTPEKPGPPKGKKKGTPWYQVEVATLYDAQGNVVQSRRLMDLVPGKDREKVRQLGKHFVWLQGVAGEEGRPPRVNDAGQLELDVAGGRNVKLNF